MSSLPHRIKCSFLRFNCMSGMLTAAQWQVGVQPHATFALLFVLGGGFFMYRYSRTCRQELVNLYVHVVHTHMYTYAPSTIHAAVWVNCPVSTQPFRLAFDCCSSLCKKLLSFMFQIPGNRTKCINIISKQVSTAIFSLMLSALYAVSVCAMINEGELEPTYAGHE